MDPIRFPSVAAMLLSECPSGARPREGSLRLTAHHLIYNPTTQDTLSIPIPLLFSVTRLPSNITGTSHPIVLRTRTFQTYHLSFASSDEADVVWDSLKALTSRVSLAGIEGTYAFFHDGKVHNGGSGWKGKGKAGWSVYDPAKEFERMGLGEGGRSQAWRLSKINHDFEFCPSYPAEIYVPAKISDTTLGYAVKYRSKGRIPGLVYLHWANHGSITRSSQPMVGITQGARSIQDEKLIEAIFTSHAQHTKSRAAFTLGADPAAGGEVYGAQATNIIIDARPTKNAYANSIKGAGTENMAYYKNCKKEYLGIDNIHVMRASLNDIHAALQDADLTGTLDHHALKRTNWLNHLANILDGVLIITRTIHLSNSHVLVHCSDGWDRTSQLSALPQLCLDPYYRTAKGFAVLIEKDWVAYGHRFSDRSGVLCNDRVVFAAPPAEGGTAQASFLANVQKQFASSSHAFKETCPVFQQFLDCAFQLLRQFPTRFEWNGRFLVRLAEETYAGRYGTFLFNSERERAALGASGRTRAVWEAFFDVDEAGELILKDEFRNADYDRSLDDPDAKSLEADQGVLFVRPRDVKFWPAFFGRTDEELNGKETAEEVTAVEPPEPGDLGVGSLRIAQRDLALAPPLPASPGARATSPGMPRPPIPEGLPSQAQLVEAVSSVQKWGWGAFKSVQKGYQEGVKQYRESAQAQAQGQAPPPPPPVENSWGGARGQWQQVEEGRGETRKPLSERLSEVARAGAGAKLASNPWAEDPADRALPAVQPATAPVRAGVSPPPSPSHSNGSAVPAPPEGGTDPLAGLEPIAGVVNGSPVKARVAGGGNPWAVREDAAPERAVAVAREEASGFESDPLGVGPL